MTKILAFIIMSAAGVLAAIAGWYSMEWCRHNVSINAPVTPPSLILDVSRTLPPMEALEHNINLLPDGALKNSLYIILAGEFSGDSAELNEILQAYAKMRLEQLQRENKPSI